ncbi:MAG: YdbH domain-containing protein [Nitrosomonas sp.]|nr:YdbH domain-containing protein [Nitrosomonas sp.]MDP1950379.1 YdbH domain-containing protein [Nitrosomonas sp.]
MRNLIIGILLATIALAFSAYAAYSRPQISLSIDDIHSPVFSAKGIHVSLVDQQWSQLAFHLDEIVVQGKTWRNVSLSCRKFQLADDLMGCTNGTLRLPDFKPLPVVFHFSTKEKFLEISVKPTVDESWQFSMRWDENIWHSTLAIANGQVTRIAHWLPDAETMPVPAKGKLNGRARLNGNTDGITDIDVALRVDALVFSDSSGLHAGENVGIAINLRAIHIPRNDQWQWQSEINWLHGEVFWQPLYFIGSGHRLNLTGTLSEKNIFLHKGSIDLINIGDLNFSGVLARQGHAIIDFDLEASNLELSALFDQVLSPFLGNTAFAEMAVTGKGDFAWRYRNGASESLRVDLYDAGVIDKRERFAFHRINARIPWQIENTTIANISFLNGEILRIPLGEVRASMEINDLNLSIPQLVVPVLDGKLKLANFSALQQENGWYWRFSGELLPISMGKLTEALQVQQMHGTLSGVIPEVSYNKATVDIKGALLFNIFDGKIIANNLKLIEPLGLAPHLTTDLVMRNLDLDMLTRTFSFGNMQGRVDMDMNNLELSNWRPIKFDASLYSSPGSYPKRISQAAIQNISALGGAGAAAAIQRSFMRFFEEFSYSRIGWQCVLRDNVCHMGGIEPDSQESESQAYTMIKGGGIPAITVMGYNRNVNWQEMINRLKRITEGNSPIIQ